MNREVKLRVRNLHAHVTCFLCDGYFVDATAITECLHSFCRTCIVRHLSEHKYCPVCRVQVHKTRPLLNIRHDQTLQDIVYTLVPGLRQNEMKRRRQFWSDNKELVNEKSFTPEELGETDQNAWKNFKQKICLSIEPAKLTKEKLSPDSEWMDVTRPITKRYIRCCHDVTIHHLHKFIKMKFREDDSLEVIMFLGDNVLPQNYSLSDVIETFPQLLGQALELTFGLYAPKPLKRKIALDDVSNNPAVSVPKKRRLPSATPQLKAFFNSQITSKTLKQPLSQKTSQPSLKNSPVTVTEKEDSDSEATNKQKLLESINLKTVENSTQVKPSLQNNVETNTVDMELKTEIDSKNVAILSKTDTATFDINIDSTSVCKNVNSNESKNIITTVAEKSPQPIEENKNLASNSVKPILSTTELLSNADAVREMNEKHSSNESNSNVLPVQPKGPTSESLKKSADHLQCYTLLNIPVDEAVRSKPPTPVEIPAQVYPKKVRRVPEFNHVATQSKVVNESVDTKSPRNRRKPTNPIHHVQENDPVCETPKPLSVDSKSSAQNIPKTLSQKVTETSTQKVPEIQKMPEASTQKVTETFTEKVLETLTQKVPETLTQKFPETLTQKVPETLTQKVPEILTQNLPETLAQKVPETLTQKVPEAVIHNLPETLTQEHLQSKYTHVSTSQQSGQFILLSPQTPNSGSNSIRAARPIKPRPDVQKQKPSQQLSYEKLSNAQAHRVALDAVRSTMSKVLLQPEKRSSTLKRPILPKVNNNISQMVINQVPSNVPSTRNIFQNDKMVYPVNPVASPVVRPQLPAKKESVSVFPRKIKPSSSNRKSDIEHLKQLRNQQLLLTQMAAAVAKSQAAKKELSLINKPTSSRNGPPPPYQAPTRNHSSMEVFAVSSSHSNSKPFVSKTNPSVPRLSNSMPKTQMSPVLQPTVAHPHTTLRRPSYQGSPNNSNLSAPPPRSATPTYSTPRNLNNSLQQQQGPSTNPILRFETSPSPGHRKPYHNNQPFVRNALNKHSRTFPSPPVKSSTPNHQQTLLGTPAFSQSLAQNSPNSQNFPYFVNSNPRLAHTLPPSRMHPRPSTPSTATSRTSMIRHNHSSNASSSSIPNRAVATHPNANWNQTSNSNVPRQKPITQPQNTVLSKPSIPGAVQQPKWSEKRKPNILRKSPPKSTFSIATPPAGTKSPWASRDFSLPLVTQSTEYNPLPKRQKILSPPIAHQHPIAYQQSNHRPPLNTLTPPLSDSSDVPLELTSKSTRSLQPSLTTTHATPSSSPVTSFLDTEQPLCLIVKKK